MAQSDSIDTRLEKLGHVALWKYLDNLTEKLGDLELRYLWRTTNVRAVRLYTVNRSRVPIGLLDLLASSLDT